MTLWGNKNRVRELEYIMVILMISQQMQPENTVNTIKWNALMTSQVFYGCATQRQAISILAWVKASFIDVQAKAPWMWSENIFSPFLSLLGPRRSTRYRSLSKNASKWPVHVLMWPGLEGSFQSLIYGLARIPLGEPGDLSVAKASTQATQASVFSPNEMAVQSMVIQWAAVIVWGNLALQWRPQCCI